MSLHLIDSRPRTTNGLPVALPSRGTAPLAGFADDFASEYRKVAAGAEFRGCGAGSDHLFVVRDGWLQRNVLLEDGRRQILEFLLPGDLFHLEPVGDGEAVEAITDATVVCIPAATVYDRVAVTPGLTKLLLEASRRSLGGAFESLVDTGRRTATEAVAHFLLRIDERAARAFGRDGSGAVPFPLIQEHIGDAVGLTAVHVCRTLRKLKAGKLIETGRGWLRIEDRGRLAAHAACSEVCDMAPDASLRRLAS